MLYEFISDVATQQSWILVTLKSGIHLLLYPSESKFKFFSQAVNIAGAALKNNEG